MNLAKLRQLAEEARHHPNYQFRDLTEAQLLEKAQKAFQKLTEPQQLKVQKSWATALQKQKEQLTSETGKEMLTLRFLSQTNLFFLCHLLEQYNESTVQTHEDICNAHFARKDPTFVTFRQFADQYTDLKKTMLLVPRGGFKSSLDIADCVQWIICFPAITILILTGVYKLAGDFVGELRQHFTLEENGVPDAKTGKSQFGTRQLADKDTGEWSDSMFQVLFPEHCISPGEGSQFEFETPAGGIEKEPTVRAASIEQALSGMHFGVLKLDDVVTNENSLTVDRLEKINKQISVNRAMLHPYGFLDVIGTWYDEQDFYGKTIKQEETFAEEEGQLGSIHGSVDSGRFNSAVNYKVYLRAAFWLSEQAVKDGKTDEDAKQPDYELWFPQRLPFDFLIRERKTDPDGFAIKYLNNPRVMHRVKFPRALLMKRTVPHSLLPPQGVIVTTVDCAYSIKDWADYTVIMTALIFAGRFYVVNMVRGRFNEFELPGVIAATAHKWKPKRIAIEDSVGVKWMGRELRREMDKLQISVPVEYVTLGQGSKATAKKMKAKPVVRLLGDERMFFSNACEGLEEIYSELEKFTGTDKDAHDDIVSGLSLLVEQFGAYAEMGQQVDNAVLQFVADRQGAARHDLVYGLGKYARYNAANDDNPVTDFQMETAQGISSQVMETFFDPLSELF